MHRGRDLGSHLRIPPTSVPWLWFTGPHYLLDSKRAGKDLLLLIISICQKMKLILELTIYSVAKLAKFQRPK